MPKPGLSLPVMAGLVPVIPILYSAALQSIVITGTRPVMTRLIPQPLSLSSMAIWADG